MPQINTVLGPIDPDQLGVTLVHEHCIIGFAGWECDPLYGPPDREAMIEACVSALKPAKARGLCSIIEATPPDLGRAVEMMKVISEKSQVQIICSTGRYTEEHGIWPYLKFRDKFKASDMETDLYDGFMAEITKGIGPTGAKAGAIKVATSLGRMAPCEEAMIKAAARASRETGVPIITHTEDGTLGPEQAQLLLAAGADPKRVMIGHMCGNPSLSYHRNVLEQGVNIALDRFGIEIFVSDPSRIETLTALLGEGYTGQIMLSHDYVGASFGRGGIWPEHQLPNVANWSYDHLFKTIIPRLQERGVTDEQIGALMVGNPRRLFGGA